MKTDNWKELPEIVRWWRIKTCKHPFKKSKKVGTIIDEERTKKDGYTYSLDGRYYRYRYVHHVRRCGHCNRYFLDSGLES